MERYDDEIMTDYDKEMIRLQYEREFGDDYPRIFMVSINHSIYIKFMKRALETGEPIDNDELKQAFSKIEYDIAPDEESMSAYEYARRHAK